MNLEIKWFLAVRFLTTIAMQMKLTILGFYLYQISGAALVLGMLGLYEALPRIIMALPAGYIVERMEKRKALMIVIGTYFILSIVLFILMKSVSDKILLKNCIFFVIFLMGLVGSMGASASITLFSSIVPKEKLAEYTAINSNSWQLGAVIGPIIAGISLNFIGAENSFLVIVFFLLIALIALMNVSKSFSTNRQEFSIEHSISQIKEGLDYVFNNKTLLWAISLDLFAVLFGGCVALLPIFAQDILHVNETGYGWLRAAMPMGSAVSMLILTRNPVRKNTGKWLMFFVAMFGVMTLGFALSESFILSMIFLILMGAFDAVSVVIRGALLVLETPENMRARVSSVNSMFISSSNEIGAFESGFAAQYLGTVRSVLFGGCMTLIFVSTAWWKAKELKQFEFQNK